MQYRSTRDQAAKQMTAPEAILQGLAPDGGLFVPQSFPQPDYDLGALVNAPYQEVATTIWGWFLTTFRWRAVKQLSGGPMVSSGMIPRLHP